MVTLTDDAVNAIQMMAGGLEIPQGVGVRIATNQIHGKLTVALAAAPAEGDAVVESSGTRLFLDRDAAIALEDKSLHAGRDASGQLAFAITDQVG